MNKPKIAFIDDEERVLRTLKMHFRRSHDVFVTTNAHELFEHLQSNHVHVVVSDQRMPEILGVDVLNRVKEISPDTLRILLTGYADLNAIIGSINQGEIFRYITKPWKPDELKKVIEQATNIALISESTPVVKDGVVKEPAKRNLLVLDDDESVYQEIHRQFTPAYEVDWAQTLEQAYELLASGKYGVAITDIKLNGENIAPIIYTLKQDEPDLTVLVTTDFKDAHLLIDLINKGQVFRCLPKPTSSSLLEISVQRAYDHHLDLVNSPKLQERHVVEEIREEEKLGFSQKVRSFLSKFRLNR